MSAFVEPVSGLSLLFLRSLTLGFPQSVARVLRHLVVFSLLLWLFLWLLGNYVLNIEFHSEESIVDRSPASLLLVINQLLDFTCFIIFFFCMCVCTIIPPKRESLSFFLIRFICARPSCRK